MCDSVCVCVCERERFMDIAVHYLLFIHFILLHDLKFPLLTEDKYLFLIHHNIEYAHRSHNTDNTEYSHRSCNTDNTEYSHRSHNTDNTEYAHRSHEHQ